MHPIFHVMVFLWFLGSFCTYGIYKLHHAESPHMNWIPLVVPQTNKTIHWSSHLSVAVPLLFVLFMLHYIPAPTLYSYHPHHCHSSFILKVTVVRLLNTKNLKGQKWVLPPSESSLREAVLWFQACPSAILLFPQALAIGAPAPFPQPPVELSMILWVFSSSVMISAFVKILSLGVFCLILVIMGRG